MSEFPNNIPGEQSVEHEELNNKRLELLARREAKQAEIHNTVIKSLMALPDNLRVKALAEINKALKSLIPVTRELKAYASTAEIERGDRLRSDIFPERVQFYEDVLRFVASQNAGNTEIHPERIRDLGREVFDEAAPLSFHATSNNLGKNKEERVGVEWEGYYKIINKLVAELATVNLQDQNGKRALEVLLKIVHSWAKKSSEVRHDFEMEAMAFIIQDILLECLHKIESITSNDPLPESKSSGILETLKNKIIAMKKDEHVIQEKIIENNRQWEKIRNKQLRVK